MSIVAKIIDIFEQYGDEEYLGEPVTMAQHMLQAAHFARAAGEPDDVVVAALLHDIGHFTSELGTFSMADTTDRYHEDAGAAFLAEHFPSVVVDCCKHHVAAKRYLCATDPSYVAKLSAASVHSLNLQGGPMSAVEVAMFEQEPNLAAIIRVRLYDDQGKDAKLEVAGFEAYHQLLQDCTK